MGKVYAGSARGDEKGAAYGGVSGDQTGREVSVHSWSRHEKGWRTLRARDTGAREKLACAMEAACANGYIGYDQWQRDTLLKQVEKVGYDVSQVETPCETDCSSLVRVCCAYAFGRDVVAEVTEARFYAGILVGVLLKTGLFEEMQGDVYSEQEDYLMRGDIQCTRTQGHTIIILSNGERAGEEPGSLRRTLRKGMSGEDVRVMQEALAAAGMNLGVRKVDGIFGPATYAAVIAFQQKNGLEADGICGRKTWKALEAWMEADGQWVNIAGGNCHVRLGAGTQYRSIGVAKAGERLEYAGETAENGWLKVRFAGQTAWVSGKYGKLEAKG